MKNTSKLILTNVFAMVSVMLILIGSNLLGMEIDLSIKSIVPTSLLVIVPQMGFFYVYMMSFKEEKKKAIA